MSYRYLIRPQSILSTPRALAERIGARVRANARSPTWSRDFFMAYPSNSDAPEELKSFYHMNKKGQRDAIRMSGIRVSDNYPSSRYVVRPLRHRGGEGFRVTDDQSDYQVGSEYIQPLFDKQWEYRLLFVKGRLCVTLFKRVNQGTPSDVPWNHSQGSTFETVNNWGSCRLRHTTILEDLQRSPIINSAHIVAVDVMLRKRVGVEWEYCVCEFNFCPSLSIAANLDKVVSFALEE